jgi:hypothetical protein
MEVPLFGPLLYAVLFHHFAENDGEIFLMVVVDRGLIE